MANNSTWKHLSATRKILASLVVVFGLTIFVIFLFRMDGLLQVSLPNLFADQAPVNKTQDLSMKDPDLLKNSDTDGDGLSDYEELYIWNTSPYLADTDSDGIDDKTEIGANGDPTCPVDTVCGPAGFSAKVPTMTDEGTVIPTAAEIRKILTGNNLIAKEELDKLSDTDLVSLYQQLNLSASGTGTGTTVDTNTPATTDAATKTDYTPAELRDMLKKSGMTDADLAALTDEELKTIYQEALKDAQGQIDAAKMGE